MNSMVSEFAERLRSCLPLLADGETIDVQVSDRPVAYPEAVAEMERRAEAISRGSAPELVWMLEHPPLYTAGTSAKDGDLIDPNRFPVYRSGRGGQFTYHGPGQLVAYVLVDLNARGRDLRRFVHGLEEWVITALRTYGVKGERRAGRPGIWIGGNAADKKIAALGVRVRRWVTYHGVAVNVCPDLTHFSGIVPCGIRDAGVTSLAEELAARQRRP